MLSPKINNFYKINNKYNALNIINNVETIHYLLHSNLLNFLYNSLIKISLKI